MTKYFSGIGGRMVDLQVHAESSDPFFSPSGSGSGAKIDKTVTSTASTSTVCLVKNMKI